MVRIIAVLLVVSVLVSCSKEKKEAAPAEKVAKETPAQSEPIQMIPDEEFTEFDKLLSAQIVPYFDAEGTVTEKAVAPGETFDIYVFGKCIETYSMSAAEYMLSLPEGIEVMSEAKSDSTVLTVGSYKKDYMMTFKCCSGPKFMMMKYICQANDSFSGGAVETGKGLIHHFLGFTLCDETRTMVKGTPGQAKLTLKKGE
jgi:hypothetical protein